MAGVREKREGPGGGGGGFVLMIEFLPISGESWSRTKRYERQWPQLPPHKQRNQRESVDPNQPDKGIVNHDPLSNRVKT